MHVCRPLSKSTIRQVHVILLSALRRAVRWGWLVQPDRAFKADLAAALDAGTFRPPDGCRRAAMQLLAEAGRTRSGGCWWLTMGDRLPAR
ncbi:hypothetical protein HBB16_13370 [Pseudonocardia sp. MCCB 268]|nr:hypothetical protein [Pseudonocardia cytotoxica]